MQMRVEEVFQNNLVMLKVNIDNEAAEVVCRTGESTRMR